MQYVDTVRIFLKDYSLEKAVPLAIDYCLKNDILKDFLLANKAEVIAMSIFEYDEELHKKTLKEEGFEEGFEEGLSQGRAESQVIIDNQKTKIDNQKAEIDNQKAEIESLKKLLAEK